MVETTADACIREARKNIADALENISSVVIFKVNGTDDFNESYILRLESALQKLLEIQKLVGK